MKWWSQLKRKREGWVERKRRFQAVIADKAQQGVGESVPAAVGEAGPNSETAVPNRGVK